MIEQFFLILRWNPNSNFHCGIRVDLGVVAMRGYYAFPKLQDGASPSDAV